MKDIRMRIVDYTVDRWLKECGSKTLAEQGIVMKPRGLNIHQYVESIQRDLTILVQDVIDA